MSETADLGVALAARILLRTTSRHRAMRQCSRYPQPPEPFAFPATPPLQFGLECRGGVGHLRPRPSPRTDAPAAAPPVERRPPGSATRDAVCALRLPTVQTGRFGAGIYVAKPHNGERHAVTPAARSALRTPISTLWGSPPGTLILKVL